MASAPAMYIRRFGRDPLIAQIPRIARHHASKAKTTVDNLNATAKAKRLVATAIRGVSEFLSPFAFLSRRASKTIPAATRQAIVAGSSVCVPTILDRAAQKNTGIAKML